MEPYSWPQSCGIWSNLLRIGKFAILTSPPKSERAGFREIGLFSTQVNDAREIGQSGRNQCMTMASRWAITLVADLSSFMCVLRPCRGRTFTGDGLRGHPCGRSRSLTPRAVCNSVCWSYKEWTVKEDHIYFRWVQPTRTLTLLQFLVCFQKSYKIMKTVCSSLVH